MLDWVKKPGRRVNDLACWTRWHTRCRRYGVHKAVSNLMCEQGRVTYYAVLLNPVNLNAASIISLHRNRKAAARACEKHARQPQRKGARSC